MKNRISTLNRQIRVLSGTAWARGRTGAPRRRRFLRVSASFSLTKNVYQVFGTKPKIYFSDQKRPCRRVEREGWMQGYARQQSFAPVDLKSFQKVELYRFIQISEISTFHIFSTARFCEQPPRPRLVFEKRSLCGTEESAVYIWSGVTKKWHEVGRTETVWCASDTSR